MGYVGTLYSRMEQAYGDAPSAGVLTLARMVRLDDYEAGFITVDELFADPPHAYIEAAIRFAAPDPHHESK